MFDGNCGFCTSSARWIEARLPGDVPVEPWQELDLTALGLTQAQVMTAAYWVDSDGALHRGHLGIGRALIAAGGLYRAMGRVIVTPPFSWLARTVYALVAKYRHKLPGSTEACRLPGHLDPTVCGLPPAIQHHH